MDMSLSKLQELVMDREPDVLSLLGRKELFMTDWMNWQTETIEMMHVLLWVLYFNIHIDFKLISKIS